MKIEKYFFLEKIKLVSADFKSIDESPAVHNFSCKLPISDLEIKFSEYRDLNDLFIFSHNPELLSEIKSHLDKVGEYTSANKYIQIYLDWNETIEVFDFLIGAQ